MTGARGSAFKVTHSQDWRVSAGYWQEASVPGHMDVSKELLEHPCNMAAGFPRKSVCPTRIPVAARDEKGFDILLGLGVKKKAKKRIQLSPTKIKGYEVTSKVDLSELTSNVFPEGLPPSYVFVSTQRFKVKKVWDLWRILTIDGRPQIAVTLNGVDKTLLFTTTSIINGSQLVNFADPRVKFDVQKLRIYCDPEQNNRETACEIPGFCLNGPSDVGSTAAPCICPPGKPGLQGPKPFHKLNLLGNRRVTLDSLGTLDTLDNLVKMVSLQECTGQHVNLSDAVPLSIPTPISVPLDGPEMPEGARFLCGIKPCRSGSQHREHEDCQVIKENWGEMEKRVTVDFLVFLGFMECQDQRVQKVKRGMLVFLAFLDVL
ncbi:hypothetical protein J1605_022931 [Eschrichtius robustus]|uniref:Laminin G domain-containing protein n=1 Tax=Eschrichtius robustus TaxID=9764 RepID=A0AB34H4A1_ESCRO|nr:hypothetical protein J1605_022931 [Eschrichtius robustus]